MLKDTFSEPFVSFFFSRHGSVHTPNTIEIVQYKYATNKKNRFTTLKAVDEINVCLCDISWSSNKSKAESVVNFPCKLWFLALLCQ